MSSPAPSRSNGYLWGLDTKLNKSNLDNVTGDIHQRLGELETSTTMNSDALENLATELVEGIYNNSVAPQLATTQGKLDALSNGIDLAEDQLLTLQQGGIQASSVTLNNIPDLTAENAQAAFAELVADLALKADDAAMIAALTNKLDKSGGTVSGVLTLNNTLDFGDSMAITRNIGNGNRGFHIAPNAYIDYDTANKDFRLVNNSKQGFIVKDNGIILKPETPAFQAFHSGTVAETVSHVIEFSTIHLNRGNHYNGANSRFTAPETGLYWFEAHVFYGLPQNTSGGHWRFRVNGAHVGSAFHATSAGAPIGHLMVSGSMCRYLNQGDYVDIHLHLHTNATLWPHAYTGFSGFLIG